MRYVEIEQFPRAAYEIDVTWGYLEHHIVRMVRDWGLDLEPDFQRAHVWTEAQQRAYVEYVLRGGEVGRNLTFSHPDWRRARAGVMQIVDGKQRLHAAREFMLGRVQVFGGHTIDDFEDADVLRRTITGPGFRWRVVELSTRRGAAAAVPEHQRGRHAAHGRRAGPRAGDAARRDRRGMIRV